PSRARHKSSARARSSSVVRRSSPPTSKPSRWRCDGGKWSPTTPVSCWCAWCRSRKTCASQFEQRASVDGLISFHASADRDPDGGEVRAFLEAHLAHEHLCAVRRMWVHGLAIAGGGMFIDACWPTIWPASLRAATFAAWAVCFLGAAAAGVRE